MVLHQAAVPSVPLSIAAPRASHDPNINATFNVLTAARETGVRRVVYAASSSAYGDSPALPKAETLPAGVLSLFIKAALSGSALTIYGDGEQTRDFIYIDNVVNAVLSAMDAPGAVG